MQKYDQYRVDVNKLPKFSNVFDRADAGSIPGLGTTVAPFMLGSGAGGMTAGNLTHSRPDGRSVISLHFNPNDLTNPSKKKLYESAMKDILEQREKIRNL